MTLPSESIWPGVPATSLPDRLAALDRGLSLAGPRLSMAEAAPARSLLERAGQRRVLSASHTVVALAGGTGSGKSSLFNTLVGMPLSAVGVRRPETQEVVACVWGEAGPLDPEAARLLDWLGISARTRLPRTTPLDPRPDPELDGLVLLDLPDHDTVRTQQVAVVDRIVEHADLVIWVVDPQKYADAALHERYLSQLAGRDEALAVVMNQLDRIEASTAAALGADLRRLIQQDGLGGATVLAASVATGGGLSNLRALVVERVSARRAAAVRLEAELTVVVGELRAAIGSQPPHVTVEQFGALATAVVQACTGDALVERLLAEGRLKAPLVVSQNHVAAAITTLVESVLATVSLQWQVVGERQVDPREVALAVGTALASLDVSSVGPSRLRSVFLSRERREALRRQGVREAVWRLVSDVVTVTVVKPIQDEVALWPAVAGAFVAAG